MKISLSILIILFALTKCSFPKKEYTIDFCTSLNSDIECDPSETIFYIGDRVYVFLECNQLFTEKKITGKLYAVVGNKKLYLASQDWIINSGDSYAYDTVDFAESGIFEFVFTDENGKVLAKNQLEVINTSQNN